MPTRPAAFFSVCVLLSCGGGGNSPGSAGALNGSSGTESTASGSGPTSSGGGVSGGASQAGSAAGSDTLPSGGMMATGGAAGAAAGMMPAAGGTGGAPAAGGSTGNWHGFSCPAGPFAMSPVAAGAAPERIEGLPPNDAFVTGTMDLIILDGPIWYRDELYLSEIENGPQFGGGFPGMGGQGAKTPPPSRILKVTAAGQVSVVAPDSGSNGLALDPSGALTACTHKTGSVARLDANGMSTSDLASMYMGSRFNSPNDLAFGPDGSLYFSDPDYQAPSPLPQTATRVYRVASGSSTAMPIIEGRSEPNGVVFSLDGKTLYVSGEDGVFSYPVMADGSLGTGTRFATNAVRSGDGMGIDCAGNLYVASSQALVIVSPVGTEIGRITVPGVQSVTNIAFGGADRKTLYITSLGSTSQSGVFKVAGAIPGMPY